MDNSLYVIVRNATFLSPSYLSLSEGRAAKFECYTKEQNVTWTKKPLHMPVTAIYGTFSQIGIHWITIPSVKLEHSGVYECISEKDMTIAVGTAELKVIPCKYQYFHLFELLFDMFPSTYMILISSQNG